MSDLPSPSTPVAKDDGVSGVVADMAASWTDREAALFMYGALGAAASILPPSYGVRRVMAIAEQHFGFEPDPTPLPEESSHVS